jgi:hypothetical protein
MSDERRYLWFAPYAGLWPWYRLEHRLADALARSGRSVTLVHCDGVLDAFCPVMAAQNMSVDASARDRARVCRDCRFNQRLAKNRGAYGNLSLDSAVTDGVREQARAVVASITRDNWGSLEIDGIAVGRYASYLTMLRHKVAEVTATDEAWREYLTDLRNSLLVLFAMPALFDEVRPTHAVVYNPLYPANRMFAELARRRGVQLVGVTVGGYIPHRYDTAGVYHHISASQTMVDSHSIRASLDVPVTPLEVAAVGSHMRELMGGNDPWVYSSAPTKRAAAEIRRTLGVRSEGKVVVALVSSPDETRSSMLVDAEYHRDPLAGFSDIPEFLAAIRAVAERMPEVDFVVRLHPRLMPNKRETVTSPDHDVIMRELEALPANAVINAPGEGLSLYDVLTISDAALNQSSSAGLEFLLLGLPVVQYDPLRQNAYPTDFAVCAQRHDGPGLATAVAEAIHQGWSLENSRCAFRWYATTLLRVLLHLRPLDSAAPQSSGVVPSAPSVSPSPAGRLARAAIPESARAAGARWLDRRSRGDTLPPPQEEQFWVDEWLLRIDAAVGSTEIWEPPVVRRGEGDLADETQAVAAEVAALLRGLGVTLGPGLGALASAFDELPQPD